MHPHLTHLNESRMYDVTNVAQSFQTNRIWIFAGFELPAFGSAMRGNACPDRKDPPWAAWQITKPGMVLDPSLQAVEFLVIEHGFRYLTESGTGDPGWPFFKGYVVVEVLRNHHSLSVTSSRGSEVRRLIEVQ